MDNRMRIVYQQMCNMILAAKVSMTMTLLDEKRNAIKVQQADLQAQEQQIDDERRALQEEIMSLIESKHNEDLDAMTAVINKLRTEIEVLKVENERLKERNPEATDARQFLIDENKRERVDLERADEEAKQDVIVDIELSHSDCLTGTEEKNSDVDCKESQKNCLPSTCKELPAKESEKPASCNDMSVAQDKFKTIASPKTQESSSSLENMDRKLSEWNVPNSLHELVRRMFGNFPGRKQINRFRKTEKLGETKFAKMLTCGEEMLAVEVNRREYTERLFLVVLTQGLLHSNAMPDRLQRLVLSTGRLLSSKELISTFKSTLEQLANLHSAPIQDIQQMTSKDEKEFLLKLRTKLHEIEAHVKNQNNLNTLERLAGVLDTTFSMKYFAPFVRSIRGQMGNYLPRDSEDQFDFFDGIFKSDRFPLIAAAMCND